MIGRCWCSFFLTFRNYKKENRGFDLVSDGFPLGDTNALMQQMMLGDPNVNSLNPALQYQQPDMDRDIAITLAELLDDFTFVNAANKNTKSVCPVPMTKNLLLIPRISSTDRCGITWSTCSFNTCMPGINSFESHVPGHRCQCQPLRRRSCRRGPSTMPWCSLPSRSTMRANTTHCQSSSSSSKNSRYAEEIDRLTLDWSLMARCCVPCWMRAH